MPPMKERIQKAETLLEALPFIKSFYGKQWSSNTVVTLWSLKQLKESFAQDVVMMKYTGINPVIVHGGGPQIGKTLDTLGIPSEFVDGQRVTNEEMIDVVEMVLGGKVNKEIVSLISRTMGEMLWEFLVKMVI